MVKPLALVFLLAMVSAPSIAQTPATVHQVPAKSTTDRVAVGTVDRDVANGVVLSGDVFRTKNLDTLIELDVAGAARFQLRENNLESFMISGDHLRIRSGELRMPQTSGAKRNLWVTAKGKCVLVGKSIECEADQLLFTEDSETSRFRIKLDGGVVVSVGTAKLAAETAVVSRAEGSYRLQGDFTISLDDADPPQAIDPPDESDIDRK